MVVSAPLTCILSGRGRFSGYSQGAEVDLPAKMVTSCSVQQLRHEPRMKLLLSGELHSAKGTVSCRVHDLSRSGACLEAEQRHEVGEAVRFCRGSLDATATISWARGGRFGIRFDTPIRATELLVQMSQSRRIHDAAVAARPVSAAVVPQSPSR